MVIVKKDAYGFMEKGTLKGCPLFIGLHTDRDIRSALASNIMKKKKDKDK